MILSSVITTVPCSLLSSSTTHILSSERTVYWRGVQASSVRRGRSVVCDEVVPHNSHLTPHTTQRTTHSAQRTTHNAHRTPHTAHLTPHNTHHTPHTSQLTGIFPLRIAVLGLPLSLSSRLLGNILHCTSLARVPFGTSAYTVSSYKV